jgi:membrane-associated phospholipid phosphatase
VRDRQFLSSLALFAAVFVAVLIGLAAVPLWLGWAGVAAVGAATGGFLAWFYWGPRPDLRPAGSADRKKRLDDD